MMNCKEFQNALFSISAERFSQEVRREMEDHTRECHSCAVMSEKYTALEEAIAREKALEPNPYTGTRILQRIENARPSEAVHGSLALRPVLVTLGLVAALATGFLVGNSGSLRKSRSGPDNIQIEQLRSSLFVRDFADEDITLIKNK